MSLGKFSRLSGAGSSGSPLGDEGDTLVTRTFFDGHQLPVVYQADGDVDLPAWVKNHRDQLRSDLHRHGAVLLRHPGKPSFDRVVAAFSDNLVDYQGGAAIRSRVDATTYTASEYPQELDIRQHSEFCYSNDWPMVLFFYCDVAPNDRGQTPLTDNRRLLAELPHDLVQQFDRRELCYVRGYGYNRTWQRSYETDDPAEVEALCVAEGRRVEWLPDGQLRTYEVRPATRVHPMTGEKVWFNYAHGFHISRMDDGIRDSLSTSPDDTDEQLWPNNVFWGDGQPIDDELITTVVDTVDRCTVQFDWHEGDLLIVDNMLAAHGRRPFSGPRRILLKIAESYLAVSQQMAGR